MTFDEQQESQLPYVISIASGVCIAGHLFYATFVDPGVAKGSLAALYTIRVAACFALIAQNFIINLRKKASYTDGLVTYVICGSSVVGVTMATGQSASHYILTLGLTTLAYPIFLATTPWRVFAAGTVLKLLYVLGSTWFRLNGDGKLMRSWLGFLTICLLIATASTRSKNKILLESYDREQKINKQNDELKLRDALKNESFANLSHDFRTPISFVKNSVQAALAYPSLDDGLRKLMTIAERYCKQSLGMINDLLDLTKLDNATEPMLKTEFDIAFMMREITEHSVLLTEKRKIKVRFSPQSSSAVFVLGNHKFIERACTNLISNAIKYTDDGGSIETIVIAKNGRAYVEVSDTGIGIKQQDQERVFGRFVQIKTEGRQDRGGVGLGLGYVKSVALSHGGETTISSEGVPGRGSKIGFWMPLPKKEEIEASKKMVIPAGHAGATSEGRSSEWTETESDRNAYRFQTIEDAAELRVLSRDVGNPDALKILIVEDNETIVKGMESFLAAEYNLRRARNGMEGLTQLDAFRPHLVITDVNMPEMGGEEMVREMRAHAYGSTIPIVVMTSNARDKDRTQLTAAGADAFLLKGCDIEDIKSVLRTQLKKQVSTKKLAEKEQMMAFRAMSEGLAHEILNPINLSRNYAQQGRMQLEKLESATLTLQDVPAVVKKLRRALDGIDSNNARAKDCVEPLRRISRGVENEGPMAMQSFNDIVSGVIAAVDKKSNIVRSLASGKQVMAQHGQLEQVVVNIIVNAQQACGENYPEPIEVSTRDSDDGKFAELLVVDHGPGMSAETMERIFQPYFTTKEASGGTGLGLHVCRQIVAFHGGTLTVASVPQRGATFKMRIPVAAT